jgi:hypothetical protein
VIAGTKPIHGIAIKQILHCRCRLVRLAVENHDQQRQAHQRASKEGEAAEGETVANALMRPVGKPDRCGEAEDSRQQAEGQDAVGQPEGRHAAFRPAVAGHCCRTVVPLAFVMGLMATRPVCGPHVFLPMPSLAEPTSSFCSMKGLISAAAFSTIDSENFSITTLKDSSDD